MPFLLNANARLVCAHGGQVLVTPKQTAVVFGGAPALAEPDLLGAPITGCSVAATGTTKPCTTLVASNPNSTSTRVLVLGRPAYVQTFTGVTDGVPPGVVTVENPGQVIVEG